MALSNPIFRTSWLRDFCSLAPTPLIVDGWLRLWLTAHFSSLDHLEDQSENSIVQRSLWKENHRETSIVIEKYTKWHPELTERKPGVIIKRNAWRRIRLGIDDRMMGMPSTDAHERYENFWQGSHTMFCIANEDGDADLLAAEVYRELNQFAPLVRLLLDLKRLTVMEVGEMMMLEEGRETFLVPVTLAYAFSERWRIQHRLPLFTKFDVSIFRP